MPRPVAQGNRADTVVLAVCVALALLLLVIPRSTREGLASTMRATVGAPLVSLQLRSERSRTALLAHDSTTRVIDSLVLETMATVPLRSENVNLRALLGLARRLGVEFAVAEVIGIEGPGQPRTVLISAGSNAGVQRLTPVVAPEGLVGMVRSVDATTSEVILLSHPDFRASAMSADQRVFGMVQTYLGSAGTDDVEDGTDRDLLELKWVPYRDTLAIGTQIVTSGIGVAYPAAIPIGTVVAEVTAEGSAFQRTYLLRPNVNPAEARQVIVVRSEVRPEGLLNVWQTTTAVDSLRQGVIAAGDSLARDSAAAVAELERERIRAQLRDSLVQAARLDSIRADSARRAGADSAAAAAAAAAARAAAPPPSPAPTPVRPAPVRVVPPPATRPDVTAPPRRDSARPDTVRRPPPDTSAATGGGLARAAGTRR